MIWAVYVIAAEVTLYGIYAVLEHRGQQRDQQAKFAEAQKRAAERDARYQRWDAWHSHGAHRVGPQDRWWIIPGGKAAR